MSGLAPIHHQAALMQVSRAENALFDLEDASLIVIEVGTPGVCINPGVSSDPSAGWLQTFQMSFTWQDSSPKFVAKVPAGRTLSWAQLLIQQPFNGSGAALSLGDAADIGRIIPADGNLPREVSGFEVNPCYTYSSATDVLLFISPGLGATSGSGLVSLNF